MSLSHATTADELWRMSHSGGRHELVRGELRSMAPAGSEHGAIIAEITGPLLQFVKSHQLGKVFRFDSGELSPGFRYRIADVFAA